MSCVNRTYRSNCENKTLCQQRECHHDETHTEIEPVIFWWTYNPWIGYSKDIHILMELICHIRVVWWYQRVTRSRTSKKDRKYSGQKKQKTNNDVHYTKKQILSNTKPTKIGDELRYSGRASSSCSTCDTAVLLLKTRTLSDMEIWQVVFYVWFFMYIPHLGEV